MVLELLLDVPEAVSPEAAPAVDACLPFAVDAVADDTPEVEVEPDVVDVDEAVFVDVPVIVTGMELRSALIPMFTQALSEGRPPYRRVAANTEAPISVALTPSGSWRRYT